MLLICHLKKDKFLKEKLPIFHDVDFSYFSYSIYIWQADFFQGYIEVQWKAFLINFEGFFGNHNFSVNHTWLLLSSPIDASVDIVDGIRRGFLDIDSNNVFSEKWV